MKKAGIISAFYRLFRQSFERLKQLMLRGDEKDIRKLTVDSWRLKMCTTLLKQWAHLATHKPRRSYTN
jgi:hypothetical protein